MSEPAVLRIFVVILLLSSIGASLGAIFYPLVVAVLLLCLTIYTVGIFPVRLRVHGIVVILMLNFVYWFINLLFISPMPLAKWLDFEFVRYGFRIYLSYIPIIVLGGINLQCAERYARYFYEFLTKMSAVVAGVGLVQYLTNLTLPFLPVQLVRGGTFVALQVTRNPTGVFYLTSTLLMLGVMTRRGVGFGDLIFFSLNFVGVILTLSRAAVLALVLVSFYHIVLRGWRGARRRAVGLGVIILLLCVVGALAVPSLIPRVTTIVNLGEANIADRIDLYRGALDAFASQPLFGIGFYYFGTFYRGGLTTHAHNSYLQFMAELGIVGFFLFFWFWFVFLWVLRRNMSCWNTMSFAYGYLDGVWLATLGLGVTSLFEHNVASPTIMVPFTCLMGVSIWLRGPREYRLDGADPNGSD